MILRNAVVLTMIIIPVLLTSCESALHRAYRERDEDWARQDAEWYEAERLDAARTKQHHPCKSTNTAVLK